MIKIKYRLSALFSVLALVVGCAGTPDQAMPIENNKVVNDYPTRDRVEYVLNCIAQHGGLTYINQYACGCKIDKIAEKIPFNEYDAAKTFSYLKSMSGDAGGVFRDPVQSKDLRNKLKDAESYAEKNCFIK